MTSHTTASLLDVAAIPGSDAWPPQQGDAFALERRVSELEREVGSLAETGLVMLLFGVFCALWAQNTGRSAWKWFFLGLFFGPITAVFLLAINAEERRDR